MGLASGMTLALLKPFFLSLEQAGYQGDICLFVRDLDDDAQTFLRARRINLIPFRKAYIRPRWAKVAGLAKLFLKREQRARLDEQLGLSYVHPHCARHIYCHAYLTECGAGYDQVMLADVRDILFQKDPFAFEMPDGLSVFMEDASQTIGTCPTNSARMRHGFGRAALRELQDRRIFCSGTIFGTPTAMRDYFARVLQIYYARKTRKTIDQGTHNYVLHKEPPPKVHRFDNDGPVLTMGFVDPARLSFNHHGLLVNSTGQVFNTLHQYDRHPELAKRLLEVLT
jgi:hypothetical protein